ncbi:RNA-binding protein Cwf29 [Diplodia seriata]|uniref:RNA-binding protein Cwf29 n=2 Tax=Diplodia seriata TaxID=420778 RepID=A0ABR3CC45_9PEZI
MNKIRQVKELNKRELEAGITPEASWHADYRDTAFIYIGGLPYDVSEGDIVTIFSQYGEPVYVNLVRDKETGKSKGFAFLKYEDQRSCDLAVDNMSGAQVMGRVVSVDHTRYKKKEGEELRDNTYGLGEEEGEGEAGAVVKAPETESESEEERRPVLKEERELAELLRNHDDDDPMKAYLIKEKKVEVEEAVKAWQAKNGGGSKKKKDEKRKHRHHRSRRDRDDDDEERRHRKRRHRTRSPSEERSRSRERRRRDHPEDRDRKSRRRDESEDRDRKSRRRDDSEDGERKSKRRDDGQDRRDRHRDYSRDRERKSRRRGDSEDDYRRRDRSRDADVRHSDRKRRSPSWDGQPSSQGIKVLTFVRDPANIAKLKAVINAGLLYEPSEQQLDNWKAESQTLEEDYRVRDEEHWNKYMQFIQEQISKGATPPAGGDGYEPLARPLEQVCPTMSCYTGARILKYAAEAKARFPVLKCLHFHLDIQGAYVVDLDEGLLEVWGDGMEPVENDRFDKYEWAVKSGGPPGSCVGMWAFEELPSKEEFIKHFEVPEE